MLIPPSLPPSSQAALEQLAEQARSLAASLASVADVSATRHDALSAPALSGGDAADEAALDAVARHYLKSRRLRDELFAPRLFSDPAWDVLLDLFASHAEGRQVCVSDASIAANVPQTTGLRWLDNLGKHGLIVRHRDPQDGRRWFVELTPKARLAVATWLRAAFSA
jgi:DNA-binding MarR family transcriptional regulator